MKYFLYEDEYELLQDSIITGFRRPKGGKKFKRVKKARLMLIKGNRDFLMRNIIEVEKVGKVQMIHLCIVYFGDDEGICVSFQTHFSNHFLAHYLCGNCNFLVTFFIIKYF